ncbi:hypothetical protein L1049_001834 [Liquidambar formosana]|uniref:Ribosomal RNA-processing protein 7 C-terminal domain-containing protein n=1 Tax=Liquidambar formosana TaxID=63359 RepID=A0AAP0NGM9_LIQFO
MSKLEEYLALCFAHSVKRYREREMGIHNKVEDLQKKHKKNKKQQLHKKILQCLQNDEKVNKVEEENQKNFTEKKKRREKRNDDVGKAAQISTTDQYHILNGMSSPDKSIKTEGEKKKNKSSRNKKRKNEEKNESSIGKFSQLGGKVEDGFDKQNDDGEANMSLSETQGKIKNFKGAREARAGTEMKTRKSKKSGKNRKVDHVSSKKGENILEKGGDAELDEVYHISSEDEDCSKGMKKWIMEYHQSRPGLNILQQRIDEFIIAHEAQQEQERKEKEARASEGGWTVVVHHKGRKKTTDSESGITVGSVAQAAVEDKMAKKKRKEVGLDFYRFQRREAKRNELMLLQSKFEQDRKRIQQLRAARKFRPY